MIIACIGDSLTYGYGVEPHQGWVHHLREKTGHKVINGGVPGDTTEGMLNRFVTEAVVPNSNYVLLMGGTNDLMMGKSYEELQSNIKAMLSRALQNGITPVWMVPIPVNEHLEEKIWFVDQDYGQINLSIQQLRCDLTPWCKENNIHVIDLHTAFPLLQNQAVYVEDGIHLSAEGYYQLFEKIWSGLEGVL